MTDERARPLACHKCGSIDVQAVETTEALAIWSGVMLGPDGTIWPACREAVLEYGDTDPTPTLQCQACSAEWKPRRRWDPLHDDDDRTEGWWTTGPQDQPTPTGDPKGDDRG